MNLHRSEKIPDWKKEEVVDKNLFQGIAEATGGVLTPGNIASGTGLYLVYQGAKDLKNQKILSGTLKIGLGRSMDFIDGMIADKTQTKSPLGEAVDATSDKLGVAILFPVLYRNNLVSKTKLNTVLAQNVLNTGFTLKAKKSNKEIHASKYGKLATASQWIFIGSSLMEKITLDYGMTKTSKVFNILENISFGSFLGLGSIASAKIIQESTK